MSLSPSLALARCGCFLFSSAFWGETNDDDFNEQRRAKECERNFIDYVNCDGFVHKFFPLASSLFLSCYGLAWLMVRVFSLYFFVFVRFKEWARSGTAQHSKLVDTFHFRFSLIVVSSRMSVDLVDSKSIEIATVISGFRSCFAFNPPDQLIQRTIL